MMLASLAFRPRCACSLPIPTLTVCSTASHVSASGSARSRRPVRHQRWHSSSSSKPSGAKDDEPVAAAPSSSSNTASPTASTPSGRIGRRRGKASASTPAVGGDKEVKSQEAQKEQEQSLNLPSVPSTTLRPADIKTDVVVSAFFSLHRPISVTLPVPMHSSPNEFSTIFTSRTPSPTHKSDSVISTLSNTIASLSPSPLDPPSSSSSSSQLVLPHDSPLQYPSHLLSSSYKPFTPPAAPSPLPSNNPDNAAQTEQATQHKSYTTFLTIVETTAPSGTKSFRARASRVFEKELSAEEAEVDNTINPARSEQSAEGWVLGVAQAESEEGVGPQVEIGMPFIGNGRVQQIGGRRRREVLRALSVKRQRRLKMKKHKYKKLRKRTLLERRKLDRA
ncbi:MAG: hypothetical protein M1814_005681 [Vezdaea aestivalis]|nr:MAG: hypothetical protein M1814_005681 [Vezdaea aestivalis]